MEIIGVDLHKRESQLSIKADDGTITDRRIVTSRDRFTAVLGGRRPRQAPPQKRTTLARCEPSSSADSSIDSCASRRRSPETAGRSGQLTRCAMARDVPVARAGLAAGAPRAGPRLHLGVTL
jgi:hypothetical protein